MTINSKGDRLLSKIEFNHDLKVVIARFSGIFTVKEEHPIGLEVRTKAMEFGYKAMFDFSNVTINVSVLETYEFPRTAYPIELFRIKSVHLANKNDSDFWNFAETTFKNAGVNVKVFYDEKEALKWLKNED